MKRIGMGRGVYLLPNLCTTASLFCGFYSVIRSLDNDFSKAAWAIIFAGIFDMLDGRLAKLTKSQSDFGTEYDSLVDLASFGLAPGILIYVWALNQFGRLGWLVTFLYFACGALRLARFNVQVASIERKYFQGLPIPAAAGMVATFAIFYHSQFEGYIGRNYFALIMTFAVASLMVSKVRYWSLKSVDFNSRKAFEFLIIAVVVIFVIALKPSVVMFLMSIAYVCSGPVSEVVFFKKRRAEQALHAKISTSQQSSRSRIKVVNLEDHDVT